MRSDVSICAWYEALINVLTNGNFQETFYVSLCIFQHLESVWAFKKVSVACRFVCGNQRFTRSIDGSLAVRLGIRLFRFAYLVVGSVSQY